MRVLCIYPGMDPRFNDNFAALRHMRRQGTELVIVTRALAGLKSTGESPRFEIVDEIPIYRYWRDVAQLNAVTGEAGAQLLKVAESLRPDIIWCSFQGNLPAGCFLKARLGKPMVVLVESLFNRESLLGIRDRWWRRPRLELRARRFRHSLVQMADVLVTSDVTEHRQVAAMTGAAKVRLIPWCNAVPVEAQGTEGPRPNRRAVYIGSLYHFKNAQRIPWMAEQLLGHGGVEEIVVVGPGPMAESVRVMQERFDGRFRYVESLPRNQALALLRNSCMAFTPTKMGGWGLFGDCWGVRTPILSLHNPYDLHDGVDACLATANGGVARAAARLLHDAGYYRRIQAGGFARYATQHTSEVVGGAYLDVLRSL